MEPTKRQKLEAAGWKVSTVAEFLDLSLEEMEMIEIRLSLSKSLKQFRKQQELSQQELADNINSSLSYFHYLLINYPKHQFFLYHYFSHD